ncbi:MAG TPA: HAMP domain-containing sensor histidine kinase [Kofleriaceae bacterium]|nr:HAMP domain-containing sensor histidine kinase [Kofleriaceae bacterium]
MSAWPALVALAVVVLLAVAMLGVDLLIENKTSDRTTELIDNSLRSVALADDLRYQAYRLSRPGLDGDQIASIRLQIAADARAYDPLATGKGEPQQWDRLQALLEQLQREQPLPANGSASGLVPELEDVITRLIEINQGEARNMAGEIADAHRSGLYADALGLAITMVLAASVAFVLLRAIRRQRSLLALHLQSLDERTRELEAFAGRTAHDLKGPLNPLAGYADLLRDQEDPTVKELAARIRRASDRMAGIIDNLLSLSVSGHPRPGVTEVRPIIAEVIDDLHEELRDAEVKLTIEDCTAAASASVLAQILRNVISNAVRYRTPSRRLVLAIAVRKTGGEVELAITDNGIGMSSDTVTHAFEPYYRAPSASGPGHGLGLAIVKRTLEAIHGSIAISSKIAQGTRVTVRLPAA